MRYGRKAAVSLLLGLSATPVRGDIDVSAARTFLDTLAGDWAGTALRTPRGVLPYDICFERGSPDRIAGVADPGSASHHWDFLLRDDALKLRFLTTFGGNTTPTWLTAENSTGEIIWFQADALDHLRVGIAQRPDRLDIRVRLHDGPHVHIRLLRRATHCENAQGPPTIHPEG